MADISIFHGTFGKNGGVHWSFQEVDSGGNVVAGGKSGDKTVDVDSDTTAIIRP